MDHRIRYSAVARLVIQYVTIQDWYGRHTLFMLSVTMGTWKFGSF